MIGLMLGNSYVLAHQGGWDEILLIVLPIVVVGILLWLANNWAKKRAETEE